MKINTDQFLWVEKYRPQTLKDCVLPKRIKSEIAALIKNKEISNLLFVGSPGTGKTTMAKCIANDLDMDSMIINMSKDGGIDILRNKIEDFAMGKSLLGNKKVVILDEADYMSAKTQAALRNFIEEYSKNCRFILTCNYPKRIIDAIHSRLIEVNFEMDSEEQKEVGSAILKRLNEILKSEEVDFEIKTVAQLVKKFRPDFRKIINELQGLTGTGSLDSGTVGTFSADSIEELAEMISKKQFTKAREWVTMNINSGFQYFLTVRTPLLSLAAKESIPDIFIILNEFDTKASFSTDPELHITACIATLMFDVEYLNE